MDKINHWLSKAAILLTVVILLSGMTYFAYCFIQDANMGVANIQDEVSDSADLNINDNTLFFASDSLIASFAEISNQSQHHSTGQDAVIDSGHFDYLNGEAIIHLTLRNQGTFPINQVIVQFSLWLNDDKQAIDKPLTITHALSDLLLEGQSQVVHITINDEKWFNDTVRQAKNRRVMAKIVAVGDNNYDGIAYEQRSKYWQLKQNKNHWLMPQEVSDNTAIVFDEHELQQLPASSALEVIADEKHRQVSPSNHASDFQTILDEKESEGEPRILSVEVKEYRDGVLTHSEKQ